MEQRALHETLNRLLWRYSKEHGGDYEWNNETAHYAISMNTENGVFIVDYFERDKFNGVVYFKDESTAQSAIEEIVKPFMAGHPEFVW